MDMSKLTVNERIKFLRKLKNYTQEQMGKFFGIKTSTYSQKERRGYFTAEDVKIVCEVFKVDPNVIIFGKPPLEQEVSALEKEKLEAEGVKSLSLVNVDTDLFKKALELGFINNNQLELLNKFFSSPDDCMREFLINHPEFIENALNSDEKTKKRAQLLVDGNLYNL